MNYFKILLLTIVFVAVSLPANSQYSGERYIACTNADCSIYGEDFCGFGYYFDQDGSIDMYWCVTIIIRAKKFPERI